MNGRFFKWVAVAAATAATLCCALLLGACAPNGISGLDEGPVASSAAPVSVTAEVLEADGSTEASAAATREQPDKEALYDLLDKEIADKLIAQAKTDADAAWIAAHPEAYKKYGAELQAKMLKLAAVDPLAVPFVRHFPSKSPSAKPDYNAPAMDAGSPAADVPSTNIPHFYQWDERWGYTEYSADGFGLAACGPTSLAMVYQGLMETDDLDPYDIGQLALENGYVVYGQGTSGAFLTEMPYELGMICWELPVSAQSIVETLSEGCPIIANVGVGYFSQSGHYFVLAGLSEDGKVILNDPYSVTRSSQLWDPELIASESLALFAYARPQQ